MVRQFELHVWDRLECANAVHLQQDSHRHQFTHLSSPRVTFDSNKSSPACSCMPVPSSFIINEPFRGRKWALLSTVQDKRKYGCEFR